MATTCPLCGHLVVENSRFCTSCGSPIQPAQPLAHTGPTTALGAGSTLGSRCIQPIGLLVPHRCGQPALSSCRVCGQPFCAQHLTIEPQGPLCAACAGGDSGYYSSTDLDYFDRVSQNDRGEDFSDLS
ncbi:MAG: zinc-ribbon domain-containing protein [Oscillochloris sp.]|nr:zinc-ribbon domain-containing protein [Oscillochloris sp.]